MPSVLDEFIDRAITSGSIILFAPEDAIEINRRAQTSGIRVWGIDAFRLLDQKIQPVMDESADYSGDLSNERGRTWSLAIEHLEARLHSGLRFELVLDEED